jgi:hypothetical protein
MTAWKRSEQVEGQSKQWWAPVWLGLVADSQAKHYRKMKNAVWLYLYLVLHANRANGALIRKTSTISSDMGLPRDTVIRWLTLLRKKGYIATVNTGRCLTIQITGWKPLSRYEKTQQQMLDTSNNRSRKYPTPATATIPPTHVHFAPKTDLRAVPNNMQINILVNNKMQMMQNTLPPIPIGSGFEAIAFPARQAILAAALAESLDDPSGIPRYRMLCRKYPEELLRKVLAEVVSVPAIKIKKSRAALFTYLLYRHVQGTTKNPGS